MTTPFDEPERRHLGGLLRGNRAADTLAGLLAPAAPLLELDGSSLTQVDAYGGAVIRTTVEAHLARDQDNRVTLIEPIASECWTFVSDLLGGPMPARCSWAGTRSPAARGGDVLLPATAVSDPKDVELILDYIGVVTPALGHGDRCGRLLQEAAAVFLDNVEQHAGEAPTGPVVCAAFDSGEKNLQLVCVNLYGPSVGVIQTESHLAKTIAQAQAEFRALTTLTERIRTDLVFTVRLAAGAGRARHRTGEDWKFTTAGIAPGFIAGIEVHR